MLVARSVLNGRRRAFGAEFFDMFIKLTYLLRYKKQDFFNPHQFHRDNKSYMYVKNCH